MDDGNEMGAYFMCLCVCTRAVVSYFIGRLLLLHAECWFFFIVCWEKTLFTFSLLTSSIRTHKKIKKEKETDEKTKLKTVTIHLTFGFNMKNQTVSVADYLRYTWFYDGLRLNHEQTESGKKRTWVFIKSLRLILKLQ